MNRSGGTDKTDIPMTTLDTPNMLPATRTHDRDEHTIMEEAMKRDVNTDDDVEEMQSTDSHASETMTTGIDNDDDAVARMTDNVCCDNPNGNDDSEKNNFTKLTHDESFSTSEDNAEMEEDGIAHEASVATPTNGIAAEYGSKNTGTDNYGDDNDVAMGVSKPSSLRRQLHRNNSVSAKHTNIAMESTDYLHATGKLSSNKHVFNPFAEVISTINEKRTRKQESTSKSTLNAENPKCINDRRMDREATTKGVTNNATESDIAFDSQETTRNYSRTNQTTVQAAVQEFFNKKHKNTTKEKGKSKDKDVRKVTIAEPREQEFKEVKPRGKRTKTTLDDQRPLVGIRVHKIGGSDTKAEKLADLVKLLELIEEIDDTAILLPHNKDSLKAVNLSELHTLQA